MQYIIIKSFTWTFLGGYRNWNSNLKYFGPIVHTFTYILGTKTIHTGVYIFPFLSPQNSSIAGNHDRKKIGFLPGVKDTKKLIKSCKEIKVKNCRKMKELLIRGLQWYWLFRCCFVFKHNLYPVMLSCLLFLSNDRKHCSILSSKPHLPSLPI